MKVLLYVEGASGERGLSALFDPWNRRLRGSQKIVKVLSLRNKSEFLKTIGTYAARWLVGSPEDCVVAAPDLYPMRDFQNTAYAHSDVAQLATHMVREVERELLGRYRVSAPQLSQHMQRFLATALKHDLEMLLLAARPTLARHLRTSSGLGKWRRPVEDQNDDRPPKIIVEQLFRRHLKRESYKEAKDAYAVLSKVGDLREILFDEQGREQCPVFKAMLDWMGQKTGITAYS